MKNQYFGDVNDYLKYGLLRAINHGGSVRVGVCWMLTPNDSRSDGDLTSYLHKPLHWRHYDPHLYDSLRDLLTVQEVRNVGGVQESGLLVNALFHTTILPDGAADREKYFKDFWRKAQTCQLLFFDPDNGMEVRSRPYGLKDSSKYLYWHELEEGWKRGHSALVYQHFPRQKRSTFIQHMAEEMKERVKAPAAFSFRTPRVVFLLLPKQDHLPLLEPGISLVRAQWGGQIRVGMH